MSNKPFTTPCCNPDCRGTWGANCPHCHFTDHVCEETVRCVVCLKKEDPAGIGVWAAHATLDCTPVHVGQCFRTYQEHQRLFYDRMTKRIEAERDGDVFIELTGYVTGVTTDGLVLSLGDGHHKAEIDMGIEDLRLAAQAFDGAARLRLTLVPPSDEEL